MDRSDDLLSVQRQIQHMSDTVESSQKTALNESLRAKLLQQSRELTAMLQQPDEVVSLVAFSGGLHMCVKVADNLKLFDLLAESSPRTAEELAIRTGADAELIDRFLRCLVSMGFVQQVGTKVYAATSVSNHMTKASVRAGVNFFYDEGLPILSHMSSYFKENGYQLPKGTTDGPFQHAHKTDLDCYSYWSNSPGVMENFNTFMQGLFGTPGRLGWLDWFPVKEVCLDGYDDSKSRYCFVDVGGGKGHEGELLLEKYPLTRGKFVLEDLPFVIDDISRLNPKIERLSHDFTMAQPIEGARVYLMQNILHNHAGPVCQTILKHLRNAMIPGYSKLLIGNIVLGEAEIPLRQCGLDIAMLYLHTGAQRSRSQWTALIESAGLRVVKIWMPPGDGDSIIEVEALEPL